MSCCLFVQNGFILRFYVSICKYGAKIDYYFELSKQFDKFLPIKQHFCKIMIYKSTFLY